MEMPLINSFIDYLVVLSGLPREYIGKFILQSGMHVIAPVEFLGPVGGNVNQLVPDEYGRLHFQNLIISPLLYCGHVTKSINEIAGICSICKRLICRNCLYTCDFTGALVCPKHSRVINGVVIGSHAQKGLWRLKVNRIREQKDLGLDAKSQIEYK